MSKSEGLRIGHHLFLFLKITQQIHLEWGGKITKQTRVWSRTVTLITQQNNSVKFWCWLERPFKIPSLHPGLWRYCPLSVADGTVPGAVQGQGWPTLTPQRWLQPRMQCSCWGDAPTGQGRDRTGPAGKQTLISVLVVSGAGAEEHGLSVTVLFTPPVSFLTLRTLRGTVLFLKSCTVGVNARVFVCQHLPVHVQSPCCQHGKILCEVLNFQHVFCVYLKYKVVPHKWRSKWDLNNTRSS